MAFENLFRADGRATRRAKSIWSRLARIARLGLGGVMIGSFLGVYAGAVLGLCYAACVGRLSPALDGALLGGAVLCLLGGGYGLVLGWTERRSVTDDLDEQPRGTRDDSFAPRPVTPPQASPAASLGITRTPEMEHAHVR